MSETSRTEEKPLPSTLALLEAIGENDELSPIGLEKFRSSMDHALRGAEKARAVDEVLGVVGYFHQQGQGLAETITLLLENVLQPHMPRLVEEATGDTAIRLDQARDRFNRMGGAAPVTSPDDYPKMKEDLKLPKGNFRG
jgi:hypothetical protein